MDGPKNRARMMPWNSSGSEGHTMFPTINLNAKGAKALGLKEGPHVMRYHGGPFLQPTTNVIADAHIYDRHVPIVKEMIERPQFPAPTVRLNPDVKDFYDFTVDDVIVENYEKNPQIKNIPIAI
jgi:hypothetical protein